MVPAPKKFTTNKGREKGKCNKGIRGIGNRKGPMEMAVNPTRVWGCQWWQGGAGNQGQLHGVGDPRVET